jgi:putative membrane protein
MTHSYTVGPERPRRVGALGRRIPWLLMLAMVGAEIAAVASGGQQRITLTVAATVLFALASLTHAAAHRGPVWAFGLLLLAGGGSLLANVVNQRTGYPFGHRTYADTLGWEIAGVPAVVPLGWLAMAYPALLVARHLGVRRGRGARTVLAALTLATWDLFLDPLMVGAGHWRWADPTPALPGIPDVPVTNYLGWLVVALAVMALMETLLPPRVADDAVPSVLYLWTFAAWVVAAVVVFDDPSVALAGGIAMGIFALPFAWSLFQTRA